MEWPELPPVTKVPCSDCPWRRNAAPGWLGPMTPQEWIRTVHGEAPIACHQTIPPGGVESKVEPWAEPGLRQCRGAAIFRSNVAKSPMNPHDAQHETPPDRESVFSWDNEFIEYHGPMYERLYEPARRRLGE